MGACEQPSKTSSSEPRIAVFSGSAKRSDVTMSFAPNVICVGAVILPSCELASCVNTAFDCWIKLSTDCAGRLRTNAASDSMYSGLAEYSSGVKHHGKSAEMIISVTFPVASASARHEPTTAFMKPSVLCQPLCSDSEITRSGY